MSSEPTAASTRRSPPAPQPTAHAAPRSPRRARRAAPAAQQRSAIRTPEHDPLQPRHDQGGRHNEQLSSYGARLSTAADVDGCFDGNPSARTLVVAQPEPCQSVSSNVTIYVRGSPGRPCDQSSVSRSLAAMVGSMRLDQACSLGFRRRSGMARSGYQLSCSQPGTMSRTTLVKSSVTEPVIRMAT